jgi:hypothetical protein
MLTAKRGREAREFRRVLRVEGAVGPFGGPHYLLHLECGHTVERRRGDRDAPKKVRCGWCEGRY